MRKRKDEILAACTGAAVAASGLILALTMHPVYLVSGFFGTAIWAFAMWHIFRTKIKKPPEGGS